MKFASLTAWAFASLLLAGCAENAVPIAATIQPLDRTQAFAITEVECVAESGVAITAEDLQRNRELALAALRSVKLSSFDRVQPGAKPVKLRISFTSYRRGKVEIWKLIPMVGRIQLTADLSLVDGAGQSVGQYRFYNGFIISGGLISVSDAEVGLQQAVAGFLRDTGVQVAIAS